LIFWSDLHVFQVDIVVFLMGIFFVSLFTFLRSMRFNRSRLKKLFSMHEMASYFMVLIILSPIFGLWITVFLLLLPTVWYLVFNVVLYGKLLEPRV